MYKLSSICNAKSSDYFLDAIMFSSTYKKFECVAILSVSIT